METVKTIYTGELRTKATHVKSSETIITDAPVDNQGRGEAFSPTDLLAAALGSCILTIIGIAAREHGFSIDGITAGITKIMESSPRRVGEIRIDLNFPNVVYTDKQKRIIRNAAKTCPVALSLNPELKQSVNFIFRG